MCLIWKILLFLGIQFLTFFVLPHFLVWQVHAQVVINEVHPAPTSGNDWVELKNLGSTEVSVNGWTVEDAAGALTTTPNFSGTTLSALGYVVVEVGNRLNNTGDSVILKNSAGQSVDSTTYGLMPTGISWARTPDGTGNFQQLAESRAAANQSGQSTPTPTPTPSPTPAPTFPSNLQLSEILSCPETDQKEWVELFNPNATAYQLTNWKVVDSAGNSRLISGEIGIEDFAVFELSSSMLNNDGDSVSLETPVGEILMTAPFGACKKGRSFLFADGTWQETNQITPAAANIFVSPESQEEKTQASPLETKSDTPTTLTAATKKAITATQTSGQKSNLPAPSFAYYPFTASIAALLDAPVSQSRFLRSATFSGEVHPNIPIPETHFFDLPPWTAPTLFGSSLLLITVGCIGLIQWYTEHHETEHSTYQLP